MPALLSLSDRSSTPHGGHRITNPDDGKVIATGTLDSLLRAVIAHRRDRNQPPMSVGEIEDLLCRQLPSTCQACSTQPINPYDWPELNEWSKLFNGTKDEWGGPGWKLLHTHTFTEPEEDARWLRAFTMLIPCDQCRAHFEHWQRQYPPPLENQASFFEWGWSAHNDVRQRQGKAMVSLDEARALYGQVLAIDGRVPFK